MKTRYGIDAPYVILSLGIVAIACILMAFILLFTLPGIRGKSLYVLLLFQGGYFVLNVLWMFYSSLRGKRQVFKQMISDMDLLGNEILLDLGCGQGMFLTKVAKYLPNGKAIGIDVWKKQDLSGNAYEKTLSNIDKQGLSNQIEILEGDMRHLPLSDNSIDTVTASLAIHNLKNKHERKKALQEIARVLKPGGKISILDFQKIQEYQSFFVSELGWANIALSHKQWHMFPPTRILTIQKPL